MSSSRARVSIARKFGLPIANGNFGAVEVRGKQIEETIEIARRVVTVRSVIDKILGDTVDCGMRIWLTYNGEKIELRSSEQRIVENTWPQFARDVLWNLCVVGLVVVSRERSTGVPFVVPFRYVRVMFKESARKRREYWAEEMGTPTRRKMEALVFVKHPPDELGFLTAPGSVVTSHALAIERTLSNEQTTGYQRSHPIWSYEPDQDKQTRPDPVAADRLYAGQLKEQFDRFTTMVFSNNQEALARAQELAMVSHTQNLSTASRFLSYTMMPDEMRATPPFLNHTFVPLGLRLGSAPSPQQNSQYQTELEMHSSMILMAFRVPPMVMEASHAVRYAAQPEQARRQWADTVRVLQQEMSHILSSVYMYANETVMHEYAASMLRTVASLRSEAMRAVANSTPDPPQEKKRPKVSEEGGLETLDEALAGIKEIDPPELNDDKVLQFAETKESLERAAVILDADDSGVLAYVMEHFRVNIDFRCRPTFELKDLTQVMQEGIMTMDVFAERAAELLNQPKDSVLTNNADRIREANERRLVEEARMVTKDVPQSSQKKRKTPDKNV